ncbi:high-affinity branched-chain amino acid ABC transporter permease LivM [Rhizobium sp. CFBP 8762]|uniref:high-affinity branched-chain amino acid ABC transporter permease LivM n=1 Tax=Rhizobium sp. CFBP 8762 TaxID=2775279 RepID=UPI0017808091|nr:high-affinity branched-chain amino acid ABC transporter permease LivM [Rhizobium sp. CFBP 8762]MBD8556609.1 high-affinity branched-chain amino acid ABC transporter permease LivM [Rhizobium sp. CFBP 8762]
MANFSNSVDADGSARMARALREAFFAGLIALGMFALFVGLESGQNIRNELVLIPHPKTLTILILAVMAARFLMVAYVSPYLASQKVRNVTTGEMPTTSAARFFRLPAFIIALVLAVAMYVFASQAEQSLSPTGLAYFGMVRGLAVIYAIACFFFYFRVFVGDNFAKLAIVALVLYPPVIVYFFGFQGSLKWIDNFGIQILIYVMLAWGLNIVVGLAGLLDLGYVAFYAVGAYSYALLSSYFGLSFWVLLPLAGILAAFWGMILGFPVLRLRGDYLAIVTLAFGEIIRLVLINWTAVTKGTFGISGIAKATLFGIKFDATKTGFAALMGLPPSSAYYKIFLFYIILALALLTAFVTIRLRRMPIGRAWEALREDEIACRALGINTVTTKLTAFAIGAMFGGFAGSFFAVRQGFVSPESFVFLESAVILAIVVLGGMGSLTGIAIAAVVMVGGTEILRELSFLKVIFGPDFTPELYRMLLFGLAMVVVMVWKPRGFVGSREPTAFLNERKAVSGSFTKEGHG